VILVDTSVWIRHLRSTDDRLVVLLEQDLVSCHPFVIGELAMGFLKQRATFLGLLDRLPASPLVSQQDVRTLVERRALHGTGLGWLDAHLLAAAVINHMQLWTLDRRLADAANDLGVRYTAPDQ
jgi:predicted nucleic acid-binding protein